MKNIRKIPKTLLFAMVIGFVAGVLWLAAVRYLTLTTDNVHYHANFALYVDGERDEFDNFTFYEEVQSCSAGGMDPKTRVHMHNQENDVIHVHDGGVTWGHFFANLGYNLGNDVLSTDDGVYLDDQGDNQLTFILNGDEIGSIANRKIESEDKLLIDYGDADSDELQRRYEEITENAGEYNQKPDPGSCAGDTELTFTTRLKKAFGIE